MKKLSIIAFSVLAIILFFQVDIIKAEDKKARVTAKEKLTAAVSKKIFQRVLADSDKKDTTPDKLTLADDAIDAPKEEKPVKVDEKEDKHVKSKDTSGTDSHALDSLIIKDEPEVEKTVGRKHRRYVKDFSYINRGADWKWNCQMLEQSPIDIDDLKGHCDVSMQFDFMLAKDPIQSMLIDKDKKMHFEGEFSKLYATNIEGELSGYNAMNLYFHSPSEHKLQGQLFDAEMHILHNMRDEFHTNQVRRQAVVAILFKVSDSEGPNKFIDSLDLANSKGKVQQIDMQLLQDALPSPLTYYSYEGSTTTPPCDEVVNWYVIEKPLSISSIQLAYFNKLWKNNQAFAKGNGNNRKIMPLNSRLVKKGGTQCSEPHVYFFTFFVLYIFLNFFILKLM